MTIAKSPEKRYFSPHCDSIDLKITRFPREEIPEHHPDKDDGTEEKDLLLSWCDERIDNVGGNEKLEAEYDLGGKFPPDIIVAPLPGNEFAPKDIGDCPYTAVYDEKCTDTREKICNPVDDICNHHDGKE